MPISIRVSELTPEMLKKAGFWKIYRMELLGGHWADIRHQSSLTTTGHMEYPLYSAEGPRRYDRNSRCFPVSIDRDGNEVRLECPRMPDEVEIGADWDRDGIAVQAGVGCESPGSWSLFYKEYTGKYCSEAVMPPTPEHSPRKALEGMWVWSTRK